MLALFGKRSIIQLSGIYILINRPSGRCNDGKKNFCIKEFKMAFASRLGPWLLGTVKNTTGTTAGTIRNMGATIVAQEATVAYPATTGTVFVLPAGALITDVLFYTTTTFATSGTCKLTIGATDITGALNVATVGIATFVASTAGVPLYLNVGSTDAIVTFTATYGATSGAGQVVIRYVVQGPDGAANPTTYQN
jgi:hypothetical protein